MGRQREHQKRQPAAGNSRSGHADGERRRRVDLARSARPGRHAGRLRLGIVRLVSREPGVHPARQRRDRRHRRCAASCRFPTPTADNYRGPGHDHRQHVDFKLADAWGEGNRIAVAGSYHDAILSSYPMPTLSDWTAYRPIEQLRCRVLARRHQLLEAVPADLARRAGERAHASRAERQLVFETTPYFEHGYGNTPYGATLPTTGLYLGTQPITQPVVAARCRDGQALVLADYIGNQYRAGSPAS